MLPVIAFIVCLVGTGVEFYSKRNENVKENESNLKKNMICEFLVCFSLVFNFKKIFVYKKTPDPTLEIFNGVRCSLQIAFIFFF